MESRPLCSMVQRFTLVTARYAMVKTDRLRADHAPSLRSPELMGAAPGSYLWSAISHGRPGTAMSAFEHSQGGPLSHDDLHALVDWLIETSGVYRQPVPDRRISGEATKGAEVYATHCASCHGENGEGGTGTALGNSVFGHRDRRLPSLHRDQRKNGNAHAGIR